MLLEGVPRGCEVGGAVELFDLHRAELFPPVVRDVGIHRGALDSSGTGEVCGFSEAADIVFLCFVGFLVPIWPSLAGVEQAMRGDFHGWP